MRLAIYQMADRGEPCRNLADAYDAIVNTQADCFILPEFFAVPGGDYRRDYTPEEAYEETGRPGEEMLHQASLHFPGYLVGGTLIEKAAEGYYNTCYVLKGGCLITKYRKINLTQEEIDMQLLPGSEVVTFDTEWGRAGLMVCFDLVCHGTRDLVGAQSDFVLAPVGMSVPDHPKVEGYPSSSAVATKHNATVVQVCRVGFYDGQPLVTKSAVIGPNGVIWEGSGEGEELAIVDVPAPCGASKKGMD
ncbi:MAG: carbon-nitrogen hydrolase family protein [Thermoleophilia bacterium]|nr:carbon-nitrogen hydrolase family protein [Thermoleophilia bacterium]